MNPIQSGSVSRLMAQITLAALVLAAPVSLWAAGGGGGGGGGGSTKVVESRVTGYVTAISWTVDSGGFRQDIELIQATQLFAYDGNYLVLGTHTFSSNRYLFY